MKVAIKTAVDNECNFAIDNDCYTCSHLNRSFCFTDERYFKLWFFTLSWQNVSKIFIQNSVFKRFYKMIYHLLKIFHVFTFIFQIDASSNETISIIYVYALYTLHTIYVCIYIHIIFQYFYRKIVAYIM